MFKSVEILLNQCIAISEYEDVAATKQCKSFTKVCQAVKEQ